MDACVARKKKKRGDGVVGVRGGGTPRLNSAPGGVPAWKREMALWRGEGWNPGSPVTPILLTTTGETIT